MAGAAESWRRSWLLATRTWRTRQDSIQDVHKEMVPHTRSKKRRFAFQTFPETPATTPATLGFGISHQPHEGGDGAKCGAKFADTLHVIYIEVTGVRSE